MGDVVGRRKIHTEVWWQNLKEQDHLEDLSVDGRIILKWTLKKGGGRAWPGLIWLRIRARGELL
jgi:hypothetical protein